VRADNVKLVRARLAIGGILAATLVLADCAGNPRPTAPGHPIEDHPVSLTGPDLDDTETEMAKLIAQSRAELPRIRARFAAGLAPGETLFLTVRLYKPDRSFEQAFAEVKEWRADGITGVLASGLVAFSEPKAGDLLQFREDVVVDWTILGLGGTEAGNRVGHFLEQRGRNR
jgi:hypothetical protein